MSKKPMQKVVVIQDASKGISLSALEWALTGLELKPGDELILLSVLHQVNTPMGYKMKVISSSISATNKAVIKEAVQKKKEEYQNNLELARINDIYEVNKIEFSVLVIPASSPKIVALEAAKALQATWIILDRQLKKDRKYFLEKLNCGISRMKRDDSVELLRGPKCSSTETTNTMKRDGSRSSFVTYDEMLPGIHDEEDLFSLEFAPKNSVSQNKNSKAGEEQTTDAQKDAITRKCIRKSTSSNDVFHVEGDSSKTKIGHVLSTAKEKKHSPPLAHRKDEREANALTSAILLNPTLEQVKDIEVISPHSRSTRPKKNIEYPDCFTIELAQCQELTRNSVCSECGNERPKIDRIREFTFGELYVATEKFASRNFLSEGGFGPVYQGKLVDGPRIAVKQHKHLSSQGEKEFKREVQVLSKARHENVVMLLGSCVEGNHRLLVYEYVCNKSLDHHLSDKSTDVLSWPDRLKIALGAAKGLKYLHSKDIIHRDMRPSNILVTHDYEPMLGDFGLARTQNSGSGGSSETRVVGTVGYVAPEYAESGKVSKKSDVYSFGVVLLELLSGRTTLDKSLDNNSLVGWAKPLLVEGNYQELIDPRIMESHDVHQLFGMVQIIESCLSKDPVERPPMDKVVHDLNCVMGGQRVTGVQGYFSPPLTTMSDGKNLGVDETESDEDYLTAKDYNTCTSEEEAPPHDGPKSTTGITSEANNTSTASAAKTVYPITGSWKGSKNKRGKSASHIFYGEMLS